MPLEMRLSVDTMFNGYYHFPPRVSFFKISESFGHVAQWIAPIYDGYDFPGFKKISQENQILFPYPRDKETRLLGSKQRQHWSQQHCLEN